MQQQTETALEENI